jgi:hypothetical protein
VQLPLPAVYSTWDQLEPAGQHYQIGFEHVSTNQNDDLVGGFNTSEKYESQLG